MGENLQQICNHLQPKSFYHCLQPPNYEKFVLLIHANKVSSVQETVCIYCSCRLYLALMWQVECERAYLGLACCQRLATDHDALTQKAGSG